MSNLTVSAPSVVLEGAIAELREREIRLLTESADLSAKSRLKVRPTGVACWMPLTTCARCSCW